MVKIAKLTDLDVDTESKQASVLDKLDDILVSIANKQNIKSSVQVIADDLGLILETKTAISDALLDSFHKYHVHSIAVLYDKLWKRAHYNSDNDRNNRSLLSVNKLMHFCDEHYINLNDYWVTVDDNGYVRPINANILKSVINFTVVA